MNIATSHITHGETLEGFKRCYGELCERLGGAPDLLLLFASEHHDLATLAAALPRLAPGVLVHGGTSSLGVLTRDGLCDDEGWGMGLWGLRDPKGDYGVSMASLDGDPRGNTSTALQKAIDQAGRPGQPPALVLLNAAPGTEEAVLAGICDVIGHSAPVLGGSTTDAAGHGRVLTSGSTAHQSLVLSVLYPSCEVSLAHHNAHTPTPSQWTVTRAEGRHLLELDGLPAAEVYNEAIDHLIAHALDEGGDVTRETTLHPLARSDEEGRHLLAHPARVTPAGGLTLSFEVAGGDKLTLMQGSKAGFTRRAAEAVSAAAAKSLWRPEHIHGALLIDCANCMLTVRGDMTQVAKDIGDALGPDKPFLGVFSLGQQGRFFDEGISRHGALMVSAAIFGEVDMSQDPIDPKEALREAQLELERARRAEERLQQEVALHTRVLGVIGHPKDRHSLLEAIAEVLRDVLPFEHIVVLAKEKGATPQARTLRTVASTNPTFNKRRWQPGKLFERVMEGSTVANFDVSHVPEWAAQAPEVLVHACSALHFNLTNAQCTFVAIMVHSERGVFDKQHGQLIDRLRPLFQQALVNLASQEQQQRHEELTREKEAVQSELALLEEATRALRASEEKFSNLFHNSLDAIILYDLEGQVIDINARGLRMFGYEADELTSMNVAELHPSQERARSREALKTVARQGTFSYEIPFLRKDGGELTAEVSASLFKVKNRDLVQGIVRDITTRRVAEGQLRALSNRLTPLLKNLHAGVIAEDEQHRVVLSNKAFCSMFNIEKSPEDLIGLAFADLNEEASLLFASPAHFKTRTAELLRRRELVKGETLLLDDGRIFERDYIPVFMDDQYQGHLWQYRDITRQHLAIHAQAASEGLKSAVLHTSLDGHITVNHEGNIVEWNPAAERTFGYTRAEVLGKAMEDLIIPAERRQKHRDGLLHRVQTGEGNMLGRRLELIAVRKNEERFPCEVSITSFEVEGEMMFAGHVRDITALKQHQKELEDAKEAAEAASRAKSNFLAVMSHEMRTPLNAILGMNQLIMGTSLDPVQTEYLQTVGTSAESLLHLINEVLDLSRIEAGQLVPELAPINLREVVEGVTKLLKVRAQDKGLRLRSYIDSELPPHLMGDPLRIRQVLVNLVGNAVKFTERGDIKVTVQCDADQARARTSHVTFIIEDTGVGIPQEKLERIFERFYQVDSSTRRSFGGSGLGLNISRHLVELMGGEINVTSQVDVGSCFKIVIPMDRAEPPTRPFHTVPAQNSHDILRRTKRVLLVEDNLANRQVACRFLEEAGYDVEEAVDGQEAIDMAAANRYDVILMDIQMPVVDGLDATAQIRTNERRHNKRRTPIVAVTAHVTRGYRDLCEEAGMNDYLAKPLQRATLLDMVDRYALTHPSVLIVDDALEMHMLLERFLSRDPYCTPHFAKNGVEAIAIAKAHDPMVILMDIEMEGMDGLETTRALRALPQFAYTPIIALTGHTDPAIHVQCSEAEITDILIKPVTAKALRETLELHIAQAILNRAETALHKSPGSRSRPPRSRPGMPSKRTAEDPIYINIDPDLADLVPGFLENCRKSAEALSEALERKDFEAIRIVGHNFKGTASPYGFDELGTLGATLEGHAKQQDESALREHIGNIQSHLRRVVLR